MTEPPSADAPYSRPPYADHSGALVAFGVLEILIALACLGLAVVVVASTAIVARSGVAMPPGARPMNVHQAVGGAAFYVLAAVVFVWLGAGSILARRWARTLMLIVSWVWLLTGVFGLLFLLVAGPALFAASPQAGALGSEGAGFVLGCVGIGFGIFFVLLPGTCVLFYRSPNVKATCEARDPVPRWTDRCPAPVLAVSLGFALNVLALPLGFIYGQALPFFGTILSGAPAIAARLTLTVVCAVLAWAVYRLRPAAWWATLGLWLVGLVSTVATFRSEAGWRELYAKMGYPPEQMDLMLRPLSRLLAGPVFLLLFGGMMLLGFGYLLWIRRYFVPPASPANPG